MVKRVLNIVADKHGNLVVPEPANYVRCVHEKVECILKYFNIVGYRMFTFILGMGQGWGERMQQLQQTVHGKYP